MMALQGEKRHAHDDIVVRAEIKVQCTVLSGPFSKLPSAPRIHRTYIEGSMLFHARRGPFPGCSRLCSSNVATHTT
jgi:hypothetical protein